MKTEKEILSDIASNMHHLVSKAKTCRANANASKDLLGSTMTHLPTDLRELAREAEKLAVEIIQAQINFCRTK